MKDVEATIRIKGKSQALEAEAFFASDLKTADRRKEIVIITANGQTISGVFRGITFRFGNRSAIIKMASPAKQLETVNLKNILTWFYVDGLKDVQPN